MLYRQAASSVTQNRLPPSHKLPPPSLSTSHAHSLTTQVTSEAYSSPSIVLAANQHDGSRIIFDDFREAYYWLRQNTPEDAKVMSWWDYGYQITAMANRTILVDNNTWNNTHISRVGQVHNVHVHVQYIYTVVLLNIQHNNNYACALPIFFLEACSCILFLFIAYMRDDLCRKFRQ